MLNKWLLWAWPSPWAAPHVHVSQVCIGSNYPGASQGASPQGGLCVSVCCNNFMSIVWLINVLKREMVMERPGLCAETLPWGRSEFQIKRCLTLTETGDPTLTHRQRFLSHAYFSDMRDEVRRPLLFQGNISEQEDPILTCWDSVSSFIGWLWSNQLIWYCED